MTSFNYYDQNPSGFFFLVRIKALVFFNLAGVTKFKNEKDSGRSSKMTPSCKLPIVSTILTPTEILRSRGIILKQFYPLLFRFHHIALTELLWFIFRAILRPRLLLKLGMYHRQPQLYLTKKGTRPSAVRPRLCYS